MAKIFTKPTIVDEVLAEDARYNILDDGGAAFKSDMQIVLSSPVITAGTDINAALLNQIVEAIDLLDTLLAAVPSTYAPIAHTHSGDDITSGISIPYTNANDIFRCDNPGGASAFVGTINGAPSGATVVYNITSGNEGAMVPTSTSQLAKMRLYNTTRSNYALISNCVTGTNTITLTASAPANWVDLDVITIASPTVIGGAFNWVDLEITDTNLMNRGALSFYMIHNATTTGFFFFTHPSETYGIGKQVNCVSINPISHILSVPMMKLNNNIISIAWNSESTVLAIRIAGYIK